MTATGAYSYVQYGKEAVAYGTEAATIESAFGRDLRITPSASNNVIISRGLGNRNAQALTEGQYEGRLEIEFTLANSHWLAAVLGSSASSSSGPYIHTYTEANDIPSITIENGIDLTTDSVRKFLGCKINTCEITASVGEPVRVRLNVVYKTETEGESLDGSPASESEDPMIFHHGSVEIPDGTTIDKVQSFTLRINNNLIPDPALGERVIQALTPGNRDYTFDMTKRKESATQLERFYGSGTGPGDAVSETADMQLQFTNGLSDANERHIQFNGTGVVYNTIDDPQVVGEAIDENISGTIRSMEFIGEDNTATTIFD